MATASEGPIFAQPPASNDGVHGADLELGAVPAKKKALQESSSLRTVRVSLEWRNLDYTITVGKGEAKREKRILKSMSGVVRPGSFVAIMGPTGSGKTSLLNALAGRLQRVGVLEGEILANGKPRDVTFKRVSAYVMQDDVLYTSLTVYETLWTAAMLRLPSAMPTARKLDRVEDIIQELGLNKARDTIIGNEFRRGISGGERKRTNIAVEMLSNPSLIFLDEPTSGLDSFQAMNVMSTLGALAHKGRTVITTIHQPRSSIYALFEDLLLLSEGAVVYFGKANEAVDYFRRQELLCPTHFNPADFFLDQISIDTREKQKEEESSGRVRRLCDAYSKEIEERKRGSSAPELSSELSNVEFAPMGKYASWWITQFRVLFWRSWSQVSRDKLPIAISLVQAIIMSLVVGALFSETGTDQKSLQDRTGVVFFIGIFVAFNGIFQMITTFPIERAIINRERAANAYRVSAFYPAKVLAEWPLRVIPTIVFITIVYWIVGLQRQADNFFIFLLAGVIEFTAMNAIGLMVSAIAPTPPVALALGPLVTVIMMLFGGFYINLDSIPKGARWVSYISPIQWGFVAYANNEFRGRQFSCKATDQRCYASGDVWLEYLSVDKYTRWEAIGYQCILVAGYHFLACIVLRLNRPRYQRLSAIQKKQQ